MEGGSGALALPVLQLLAGVLSLQHALGALHGMLDASVSVHGWMGVCTCALST